MWREPNMAQKEQQKSRSEQARPVKTKRRLDIKDTLTRISQDLSDYTEQELQLNLDLLTDRDRNREGLSGILIYDLAPKWQNYQRILDVTSDAEFTRHFTVLGHPFSVRVKAARIRRKSDDEDKLIFPGDREQVVEDTLRWMSTHGYGKLLGSNIGTPFTIGFLRSLLKKAKHTMSYADITEALLVLHYSNLQIRDEISGHEWSGTFLPTYQSNGSEIDSEGEVYQKHWLVTFHELVNKAMLSTETRMVYWHTLMAMTNNLAKYIYRRISLIYLQASSSDPYTISLSEIMSGFGKPLEDGKPIGNAMRDMDRALKVLGKLDVIDYERVEVRKKKKKGERMASDAVFTFFPGKMFIDQAIIANQATLELESTMVRVQGQRKVQELLKGVK
ncbi:hypothetical protein [Marinobacter salarius]|uniref:Replication protein n=1 Tax=Marinobacter salarius TaxID=1420917 RepID=A0A1W6KFY5_9GAMM|nr:hypothetical protein [Marinobacter salarius]ARM86327.1 hypothetical protein MARSALSMR5_04310 [Marinobacter salarius]